MRKLLMLGLCVLVVGSLASCADLDGGLASNGRGGGNGRRSGRSNGAAGNGLSIEYKLAVIHGDESTEDEFGRILDDIQDGGKICNPESDREHVADLIVASWEESPQRDSLLEWARALADVC